MKNFTLQEIKDYFILPQLKSLTTLRYHHPHEEVIRPYAMFITKEHMELAIPNFPIEKMPLIQHNKSNVYNHNELADGYIFPQFFASLYAPFFKLKNLKQSVIDEVVDKTVAWSNNEIDLLHNKPLSNKDYHNVFFSEPDIKDPTIQAAADIALIIQTHLHNFTVNDVNNFDLLYHLDGQSSIATNLASKFENENDIEEFYEKVFATNTGQYTNYKSDNLRFNTFAKAVKNYPDESFKTDKVPHAIIEVLKTRGEGSRISALNILKKYKFDLYKEELIHAYETSDKTKFVQQAHAWLEKKNALKKLSLQNVFQLDKDNLVYEKEVVISFVPLKSHVNHHAKLAETLIAMSVKELSKEFRNINYSFNADQVSITVRGDSYDKAVTDTLKNQLHTALEYAFSDEFLNLSVIGYSSIREMLSNHSRNTRTEYEDGTSLNINEGFTKWKLKEKLDHDLDEIQVKKNVKKI